MSNRTDRSFPAIKLNQQPIRYRRPFWLPAANYYILSAAAGICLFFLIWGILYEGNEEMPYLAAGISTCLLLMGAVILREVILRNARLRYLAAQKRLDSNLDNVAFAVRKPSPNKVTLEKNSEILSGIKRKSEAANVLNSLSKGHLEVFEMCNEYLLISANELKTVAAGSPRIAAFRRGRETVKKIHRFHLLRWAEIETTNLMSESRRQVKNKGKLETAQNALTVLDTALGFYPEESQLLDSKELVNDFITSIKVSHWMELAERSVYKGNHKRAVSHYRDALFYLGRDNVRSAEKDRLAETINDEIDKIRRIEDKNRGNDSTSKRIEKLTENYD